MDEKEKVQWLIHKLGNKDCYWRCHAAIELGYLREASAVPALTVTLKDEYSFVRGDAVRALGRIGDAYAILALIEALNDESKGVRLAAINALGNIRDPSAVPALIDILKDQDADILREACCVLKEIGKLAVTALIEALKDKDSVVRWNAAWVLGEIFKCSKTVSNLQEFEDNLDEGLIKLRKNYPDKKDIVEVEFKVVNLKMKAAEKKNELAGKKDLLLTGKPKPPKKGQMFQQIRRIGNGR